MTPEPMIGRRPEQAEWQRQCPRRECPPEMQTDTRHTDVGPGAHSEPWPGTPLHAGGRGTWAHVCAWNRALSKKAKEIK